MQTSRYVCVPIALYLQDKKQNKKTTGPWAIVFQTLVYWILDRVHIKYVDLK